MQYEKDYYDYKDPAEGIMTECCKSFVKDYFDYLEKDDIIMANSILYQFNHCPWLERITDRPEEMINYMIMEGRKKYAKKVSD